MVVKRNPCLMSKYYDDISPLDPQPSLMETLEFIEDVIIKFVSVNKQNKYLTSNLWKHVVLESHCEHSITHQGLVNILILTVQNRSIDQ